MTVRRTLTTALSVSVALAGLVTVTAPVASGAPPINMQPRVVTNTIAWAAVKTVGLGANTTSLANVGIAVNGDDDTVYVVNSEGDRLYVINGRTGLLDASFSVTDPMTVAVDQDDDTIYTITNASNVRRVQSRSASSPGTAATDVAGTNVDNAVSLAIDSVDNRVFMARTISGISANGLSYFSGPTPSTVNTQPIGGPIYGIAVDQLDDSVWLSYSADDSVRAVNGSTNVPGPFVANVGYQPLGIAVNGPDNRVYVADAYSTSPPLNPKIYVIDGQASSNLGNFSVPGPVTEAQGIAVDDSTDRIFVAIPSTSTTLGIINEANTAESVYLIPAYAPPSGTSMFRVVAVDDSGSNQGLVWAYSPTAGNVVQAFTRVMPSLTGTTIGEAGARVYFTVVSPEVSLPFAMDDTTVSGVRFSGGSFVTSSLRRENATTWSVVLPSGLTPGQAPVEVRFNGNQVAFAGDYTVQASTPPSPPPPPPVFPPGAPTDVKATGGSGEATVSWAAPTDFGSFPITEYQVTSSSGSHTCLSKTTSCTVTGLTGGTQYTFTVRALNGAGWGAYSSPSNAVTPTAKAILITGSRDSGDDRLVKVRGTTTDLAGKQVVPYVRFPGETDFAAGTGVRTVSADGTFTWQRKTGKRIYVFFQHASIRSNTVSIAPR